jgi:manganese/zinc/iron transport system permease protein
VLYGTIELAAQDLLLIGDRSYGPQALWVMGGLLLADCAFVALLYKELKVATFDPALAAALGFPPAVIQYLLMAMVSMTAVGGFTAVGAVLVVALFIVPAATAFLLTDRLARLIGLAVALGVGAAVIGTLVAFAVDTSIAGAIATVAGVGFGVALIFSPSQGLLRRLWRPSA